MPGYVWQQCLMLTYLLNLCTSCQLVNPVNESLTVSCFYLSPLQVVERSRKARINSRDKTVRNYFYGPRNQLHAHGYYVNFSEVKIFKIGGKLKVGSRWCFAFALFSSVWGPKLWQVKQASAEYVWMVSDLSCLPAKLLSLLIPNQY